MSTRILSVALLLLAVIANPSRGQDPEPLPFGAVVLQKEKEKDKTAPEKKILDAPPPDIAQAPNMGNDSPSGFSPHMLGDFPPTFARVRVNVFGTLLKTTTITTIGPVPGMTTTTTT